MTAYQSPVSLLRSTVKRLLILLALAVAAQHRTGSRPLTEGVTL